MSDIVEEFQEISRRDDCFKHMVPSDVRRMLGEIARLREERDVLANHVRRAYVSNSKHGWEDGETEYEVMSGLRDVIDGLADRGIVEPLKVR